MKILVGTGNKVKINAAKKAFEKFYDNVEAEGYDVESEVSEEPINEEAATGAKNRVKNIRKYAKEHNIKADFYAAAESGIIDYFGDWLNITITYIEDEKGNSGLGMSCGYPIPKKYIEEIKSTELQTVVDRIFNEKELGKNKGAVNIITHGEFTREGITEEAFIMALTKFINGPVWEE